ncbi:MAG: ATP-binding cassette domain-containing protein [Actinomycetota bacterium]|nr:ATP-binding cassette domain-containing protein [Actinomycetota bacterium]
MLENVSFSYPGREEQPSLENLSTILAPGEFVAVAGHNGAGKSTLCHLLNSLLLPCSGRVVSCGLDTREKSALPEIRRRVGLVMQNPDNQIVGPTVEDDVAFGPENLGLERDEIERRVEDALEIMRISSMRHREPHLLSLGERKRLAIAGVLAMNPDILVSDESTSMLDPPARRDIMRLFDRLREDRGITVIHSTHRSDEILVADRVVLLVGGRLAYDGTTQEFFSSSLPADRKGLHAPPLYRLARELELRGFSMPEKPLQSGEVLECLRASS